MTSPLPFVSSPSTCGTRLQRARRMTNRHRTRRAITQPANAQSAATKLQRSHIFFFPVQFQSKVTSPSSPFPCTLQPVHIWNLIALRSTYDEPPPPPPPTLVSY